MTLTTEITALTSQVSDLVQRVDSWVSDADAQLAAALRAIPQTRRVIHVDASTGDDSASGAPDAPVASLREAFSRQVPGGEMEILLLSDAVLSDVLRVRSGVHIHGWDAAANAPVRRRLTVHGGLAQNTTTPHNCTFQLFGRYLRFAKIDYVMPSLTNPDVNTTASIEFIHGGNVLFYDCSIDAEAGAANSHLINAWSGLCGADFKLTTMSAAVAPGQGRLFSNVSQGADPNTAWNIATNITQN